MLNLLSNFLDLKDELKKKNVFDPLLDLDANYFINIKRIQQAKTIEFTGAYNKVNQRFDQIGRLLLHSSQVGDKLFRAALSLFHFPEVNGICLGYSNSKYGSGIGRGLREQILNDAKQIIDAGTQDPEIFHLVGLFERNIGPDRLSDMIACIIKEDIEAYTLRINSELEINSEKYPDFEFANGFLLNPFKNKEPLLLLPQEILHELPIAKDWEDIDTVCNQISAIKQEINDIVGKRWSKMATSYKKDFLKEFFISRPNVLSQILEEYRASSVDQYDFNKDVRGDYLIARIANSLPSKFPITMEESKVSPHEVALKVCMKFKDLVENNKVSELLYVDSTPRNEKIVQRAFFCVADSYCNAFNIGISVETDSGRGPVDFKFETSYEDRTLVEIKLTSSGNLLHGMETQLQEYAKAEKTQKLIYLVIHNGGPQKRIDALNELYANIRDKVSSPELIFVDATPKESASKYKTKKSDV